MNRSSSLIFRKAIGFVLLCLLIVPAMRGADGTVITYRRVFKGSNPEFIEIKVPESGDATFDIRQLSEDADPQPFPVGTAVRAKIIELAMTLHNFEGADLDVHRRIANLGEKTLRYENGASIHETHYNYTLNHDATQLAMIFEGLSQQQQDLALLENRLKYDRLGVNDGLRQFESDLGQHILPEPERLLPVLDRIASDNRVVDVARQRARALAERIRTSQTN